MPAQPQPNRPASFDRLLLDHMSGLRRLAVRLAGSNAEDVVSETVVRVLRRWASFDPARGTFYTWLCWMARDTARQQRGQRPAGEALPSPTQPPTQEQSAMLSWVRGHMGDRDVRAAALLGVGWSLAEIGESENIQPSKAKYRARRGRAKLLQWAEAA